MSAIEIVEEYYQFFNTKNWDGMLSLLHPEIKHEANQGGTNVGKEAFAKFLQHMEHSYDESLTDMVFMGESTDTRVAVEFVVKGIYKNTDGDLPEAKDQKYVLPAGAFLEINSGLISRITTYYNLPLWIKMVSI